MQLTRRTRAHRAARWRTQTMYAITDLGPQQARPDKLATWIRWHWQSENCPQPYDIRPATPVDHLTKII